MNEYDDEIILIIELKGDTVTLKREIFLNISAVDNKNTAVGEPHYTIYIFLCMIQH